MSAALLPPPPSPTDALVDKLSSLSLAPNAVLLTLKQLRPAPGAEAIELCISPRAHDGATALVHDVRMCAHKCEQHDHPERPERITEAFAQLSRDGLALHCARVPARLVTREEVCLVHEAAHWDRIEWAVNQQLAALCAYAEAHDSVFLNHASMECARLAAGGVLELTREVMAGRVRNGMALVRPPGHHAEVHTMMGFSLFNTVAIAAQYARSHLGAGRVLIVDWDIHHGNGIQHAFEEDPSVLYFSVHRFEKGRFYPSTDDAAPHRVGKGAGEGATVNVGWNTQGHAKPGDAEYLAVWREVLMPIATAFRPDLVLVAAGFDAAEGDPLGMCHVTPLGYAKLTRQLQQLAGGKLVLALEGGYSLAATSASAAGCMAALLGVTPAEEEPEAASATGMRVPSARIRERLARRSQRPSGRPARKGVGVDNGGGGIDQAARKAIDETKRHLARYWPCLAPPRPISAALSAVTPSAVNAPPSPPVSCSSDAPEESQATLGGGTALADGSSPPPASPCDSNAIEVIMTS
ncbi:hypothetical protein AB1Y20_007866 [Prymnesium parvum]|uniref:Histone deacetylase domain-containing protein n=1 Tax=Prymnesium parvum TaxID=97485 RepID=A0AB34IV60_PRYPA